LLWDHTLPALLYIHNTTTPPNHVSTYQLLFKNRTLYNSCDFIFRTLSYYVIVKTYGDILTL